jgi:hypothetical protein
VTLVELLIVMGILAIIGGMAIPTLARLGAFSQDDKADGARELLNILKAARVYAATYRVDTAVYYTLADKEDLVVDSYPDPTYRTVLDGFGLARGLTDKERREQRDRLRAVWEAESGVPLTGSLLEERLDKVFFPVEGKEGSMRFLPRGACLPDPDGFATQLGMRSVLLYMDEDLNGDFFNEDLDGSGTPGFGFEADPIRPREDLKVPATNPPTLLDYDIPYGFPAHIFRPTGQVDVAFNVPPRIVLEVTPSPEAPIDEQYEEYISVSDNEPVAPIGVELYTATGRAVMGS